MKKITIFAGALVLVGTLCSCTPKTTGSIAGHEYVDLGLSVKWATTNIGADCPLDYGNYYAWGETRIKGSYYSVTSLTEDKDLGDIAGNPQYDAATANWGKSWRLPTLEEIDELLKKCEWQWATVDENEGLKVTGPNGNSIFLPAAGYFYGDYQCGTDIRGRYWSSSPNGADLDYACDLEFSWNFSSPEAKGSSDSRCLGETIRPVTK